jgi:hypothetical protein
MTFSLSADVRKERVQRSRLVFPHFGGCGEVVTHFEMNVFSERDRELESIIFCRGERKSEGAQTRDRQLEG